MGYTDHKDLGCTKVSWCWMVYAVNARSPPLGKKVGTWKRDWEKGDILLF